MTAGFSTSFCMQPTALSHIVSLVENPNAHLWEHENKKKENLNVIVKIVLTSKTFEEFPRGPQNIGCPPTKRQHVPEYWKNVI